MQNVSSSYFDAASLAGALLAASFLGAWTSRRGLAGIEGVVSSFMMHEQLQLASSGNQFSKIGHI